MTRSKKIAATLAALTMSAGIALAPTASFAATQHDGHGAKNFNTQQVAMYGKYRDGKNGGDRNYDRDGNRDRDDHGARHEKIDYRFHKHAGHWGYVHGHRMWIVVFHAR